MPRDQLRERDGGDHGRGRPGARGRRRGVPVGRLQRHSHAAGPVERLRADPAARGGRTHRRAGRRVRRRRAGLAGDPDQPDVGGRGHRRCGGRCPCGGSAGRRRLHLRHAPGPEAAGARRRHRRAQRHEVPGRALRRAARRRPRPRPGSRRARHPQPGPGRRHPRADGGLDRPARAAHLPAALGAGVRQRSPDRPAVRRSPGGCPGAAPEPARGPRARPGRPADDRLRGDHQPRAPRWGGRRRGGRGRHQALGPRHQPRRRRVHPRASPPLARGEPAGARRPAAAVGRHRGRRGPVGGPLPQRWTRWSTPAPDAAQPAAANPEAPSATRPTPLAAPAGPTAAWRRTRSPCRSRCSRGCATPTGSAPAGPR